MGQAHGRQRRDRLQSHSASATALNGETRRHRRRERGDWDLTHDDDSPGGRGSPPTHTCLRGCVLPPPGPRQIRKPNGRRLDKAYTPARCHRSGRCVKASRSRRCCSRSSPPRRITVAVRQPKAKLRSQVSPTVTIDCLRFTVAALDLGNRPYSGKRMKRSRRGNHRRRCCKAGLVEWP